MGSWVGEGFVIVGVEIGVCFSLCDMGFGKFGVGNPSTSQDVCCCMSIGILLF